MAFFPLKPVLLGQVSVNDFLTPDQCRSILASGESNLALTPGATEDGRANIRKSEIAWLGPEGEHRWLFERIKDCVNDINNNWFGFNLTGFEGIQFTKYVAKVGEAGDYYGAHKDSRLLAGGTIRKLSFTIQLCEAATYEGGDVVLYDSFTDLVTLNRALGSISFFPSYTIHEVTPVTKGNRFSLVGWACGPAFV